MKQSKMDNLPQYRKEKREQNPTCTKTNHRHGGQEMKATVNENCIGCGLCTNVCPGIFEMGDDGFAHAGDLPDSALESAQNARDECPVSAISIKD